MQHTTKTRLAWLWVAIVCAYFLWEAGNYRGIYAWLAEWQLRNFGGYVPLFTFAGLAFLLSIPSMWVLRRKKRKDQDNQPSLGYRIRITRRFVRILFAGTALVAAASAMTFVWALFMLPVPSPNFRTVSVSDAASQKLSEGSTRLVGGEIGTIATFEQYWFIDDDVVAFAPYRAADSSRQPARFFVELKYIDQKRLNAMTQRASWSGLLVEGGLPGTIRSLYSGIGIRVGNPYYTLYLSQASLQARYWVQAGQLALSAFVLLLLWLLLNRKLNRLVKERDGTSPT